MDKFTAVQFDFILRFGVHLKQQQKLNKRNVYNSVCSSFGYVVCYASKDCRNVRIITTTK